MWRKYGDVRCVFVWEDDADDGQAFRLSLDRDGTIQSQKLGIDRILKFDKQKSCSVQEIADCFAENFVPESPPSAAAPCPDAPISPVPFLGFYPDEIPEGTSYVEGLAQQVLVNHYERSAEARNACIGHYQCICQVCGIDFSKRYGPIGKGFIHVHHRVPISSIGINYRVDPIKDLVPVCPNCHAMLHRSEPPLEIEELRALLNDG